LNDIAEVIFGLLIDGDSQGFVGGMITNSAFGNRLAERLLEKNGIGDDLDSIGGPRLRGLFV
jgi:hypothetical protein